MTTRTSLPKFLCEQCPAFADVLFVDHWTTQDRMVVGLKCNGAQCNGAVMLVLLDEVSPALRGTVSTVIVQQQKLLDLQRIQERLEETEAQISAAAERAALYQRVLKGLM